MVSLAAGVSGIETNGFFMYSLTLLSLPEAVENPIKIPGPASRSKTKYLVDTSWIHRADNDRKQSSDGRS
ncbi:hypothetical protein TNCV_4686161 [Trichonephila clavipes]|nr:hypothetical protein TNCV_4686161 [Trichonephila clavipes]